MKKVLVISSTPRAGGNSEKLAAQFALGAEEAGNRVETILLREKKVNFCRGCELCSARGLPCPQKDDAAEIIQKMIDADVIVLASPVYFYSISAQLKALIDRCCGRYTELSNKEFFYIFTAADSGAHASEGATATLGGFLECLENPELRGIVLGDGVWHAGEIDTSPALKKAFAAGSKI